MLPIAPTFWLKDFKILEIYDGKDLRFAMVGLFFGFRDDIPTQCSAGVSYRRAPSWIKRSEGKYEIRVRFIADIEAS